MENKIIEFKHELIETLRGQLSVKRAIADEGITLAIRAINYNSGNTNVCFVQNILDILSVGG